ncbi:MAG: alkaline phosphatase, partial [Candidatus Xenobia bacterium]
MKRRALLALVLLLSGSLLAAVKPAPERSAILFVADGLGPAELTTLQLANPHLQLSTVTHWGSISVQSLDNPVPDAASASTALATGHRTRNGLVAMDAAGNKLATLLEAARQAGKLTGIVTNLPVTHASVASFAAHLPRHDDEMGAAIQYVSDGPDVILGGGAEFFLPTGTEGGRRQDGKNLVEEASAHGYRVVRTSADLQTANGQGKMLGLFANGALDYEVDRVADNSGQPSLSDLTRSALSVLSAS